MTRNRRSKAEIHAHQAATGMAYLVARRQIAALAEVMQQHPRLNSFGIGVFDPLRKTAEQRRTDLAAGREELAGGVAMVMETAEWLRENVTPIKTPAASSYSVKHVMERATGRYVTNGEFIANWLHLQVRAAECAVRNERPGPEADELSAPAGTPPAV